jgi:hypothetical protein
MNNTDTEMLRLLAKTSIAEVDIVIPLGHGSLWGNNELRYCLRSVEKYITGYRDVYIVGEVPGWIQNIIHLPMPETGISGPERIMRKILRACREEAVSDRFLFLNDDFFFLSPIQANCVPFYYDGNLEQAIQRKRKNGGYKDALVNTMDILQAKGLPTLHYDGHLPIIYDKKKFIEVMHACNWKKRFGYVIKSLYANSIETDEKEPYPDCKIDRGCSIEELHEMVDGRFMFSIGDNAVNDCFKEFIEGLFNQKSKYE